MKPLLAFITPWPPEESGCAAFSYKTVEALVDYADIDVFTDCVNIKPLNGVKFYPVDLYHANKGKYAKSIAVIGNSHFHYKMYKIAMDGGCVCINHDSRIINFLRWKHQTFGNSNGARDLNSLCVDLSQIVSGSFSNNELTYWIDNPTESPYLFFNEIMQRADRFIVHSKQLKSRLELDHNKIVDYLPFSCMIDFSSDDLAPENIIKTKQELNINMNSFNIITCGIGSKETKYPHELIKATRLLIEHGIKAELYFVGRIDGAMINYCRASGIHDKIHYRTVTLSNEEYKKFIISGDIAVQLRAQGNGKYIIGQLASTLVDCLSSGLQVISNDSLANSFEPSSRIISVGNVVNESVIFNMLLKCYQDKNGIRDDQARKEYCTKYSFKSYAEQLIKLLDL